MTTQTDSVRLNVRIPKDERDAYNKLCRELGTTASRELKVFIKAQLHAAGMYDLKKGVINDN